MTIDEKICYYCDQPEDDMRPYGPGGSWVCHPCATATPERDEQTNAVFQTQLEAAAAMSGGVVMMDMSTGDLIPLQREDMENVSLGEFLGKLTEHAMREADD